MSLFLLLRFAYHYSEINLGLGITWLFVSLLTPQTPFDHDLLQLIASRFSSNLWWKIATFSPLSVFLHTPQTRCLFQVVHTMHNTKFAQNWSYYVHTTLKLNQTLTAVCDLKWCDFHPNQIALIIATFQVTLLTLVFFIPSSWLLYLMCREYLHVAPPHLDCFRNEILPFCICQFW